MSPRPASKGEASTAAGPPSTAQVRFVPGEPQGGGYRRLVPEAGEQHLVRADLSSGSLPPGWRRSAAELFTHQVAEAMVQAVGQVAAGPFSGGPLNFAMLTGDATDNCQLNELRRRPVGLVADFAVGGMKLVTPPDDVDAAT